MSVDLALDRERWRELLFACGSSGTTGTVKLRKKKEESLIYKKYLHIDISVHRVYSIDYRTSL